MKRPKCKVCKERISLERTFAALTRGKEPSYCSETCSNTANVRRTRANAKGKK